MNIEDYYISIQNSAYDFVFDFIIIIVIILNNYDKYNYRQLAQLVERFIQIEKVIGSSPILSTKYSI